MLIACSVKRLRTVKIQDHLRGLVLLYLERPEECDFFVGDDRIEQLPISVHYSFGYPYADLCVDAFPHLRTSQQLGCVRYLHQIKGHGGIAQRNPPAVRTSDLAGFYLVHLHQDLLHARWESVRCDNPEHAIRSRRDCRLRCSTCNSLKSRGVVFSRCLQDFDKQWLCSFRRRFQGFLYLGQLVDSADLKLIP